MAIGIVERKCTVTSHNSLWPSISSLAYFLSLFSFFIAVLITLVDFKCANRKTFYLKEHLSTFFFFVVFFLFFAVLLFFRGVWNSYRYHFLKYFLLEIYRHNIFYFLKLIFNISISNQLENTPKN